MPVSTGVTSLSAGTTGLTPATPRTGAVTIAGTLAAGSGGTGLASPGASGNVLTSNGTAWTSSAGGSGTVTSVALSGGSTGLTTSGGPITSSGTITVAGTLVVANGGTGVATLTGVVKGNGASAFSAATAGTDYAKPDTAATWTGIQTFDDGKLKIGSATVAAVSGTAPLFLARAWVNFNGTGTVAIRGSGNVSSITDNGTGDYTVNFTTAMPDAEYVTIFGGAGNSGGDHSLTTVLTPGNPNANNPTLYSTTQVRIRSSTSAPTVANNDTTYFGVAIFR